MRIEAHQLGKRYGDHTLFKNMSFAVESGECLAITGANGSGKSTLIQLLYSYVAPTFGSITYSINGFPLPQDEVASRASFASPYIDLPELMTMDEVIKFHFTFKDKMAGFEQALTELHLNSAKNKLVRNFSSGMKQRLKLALALFSASDLLLLDEPTANLDEAGIEWYGDTIEKLRAARTTIVASNMAYEYAFCKNRIHINAYQPTETA
jgi:ABC-type multidrug transport system ATPase subunit